MVLHTLVLSCSRGVPKPASEASVEAPPIAIGAPSATEEPRLHQIRLTLSSPEDLQVQTGTVIEKGDVLAERVRVGVASPSENRNRIQAKLKKLKLSLIQLNAIQTPNLQPRPLPHLPPVRFIEQERAIDRQAIQVKAAQRRVQLQQQKITQLSEIAALPDTVYEHETAKLASLQEQADQATASLHYAQALLASAQQNRAYQVYQHQQSVRIAQREQANQKIAIAQQQQDLAFAKARIQADIGALEGELQTLSAVRSAFNGTIDQIRWLGQSDQSLTVELTIAVKPAIASAQ